MKQKISQAELAIMTMMWDEAPLSAKEIKEIKKLIDGLEQQQ